MGGLVMADSNKKKKKDMTNCNEIHLSGGSGILGTEKDTEKVRKNEDDNDDNDDNDDMDFEGGDDIAVANLGVSSSTCINRRRASLNPAAVGAEFIIEKRKYGQDLRDRLLGVGLNSDAYVAARSLFIDGRKTDDDDDDDDDQDGAGKGKFGVGPDEDDDDDDEYDVDTDDDVRLGHGRLLGLSVEDHSAKGKRESQR